MHERVLNKSLHCADWDKRKQDSPMSYLWQGSTHWNETFHRFASHLDFVVTHEKRVIALNLARGLYLSRGVFGKYLSWKKESEYVNSVNNER